jgi:hypothetical protein
MLVILQLSSTEFHPESESVIHSRITERLRDLFIFRNYLDQYFRISFK